MKICDYCGRENSDEATQCCECGTPFKQAATVRRGKAANPVPERPKCEFRKLTLDEMKMDLVTLLSCRTTIEADLVVEQLGGAGIRAFIPDEFLMQAVAWNVNTFGYVRVQVSPNDYEAAKTFLLALQDAPQKGGAASNEGIPPPT